MILKCVRAAVTSRSRGLQVIVLVLLGSIVRFWYGYARTPWQCAPDQTAWALVLEYSAHNEPLVYNGLIHYPHEGGSLFLSLLALLVRPFAWGLPPLSWAALLVDTVSRYIQIRVAERLFGRTVANWFAVWTVCAVPLLLPWGTVNFGLHALTAFMPFLFIRYASDREWPTWKLGLLAGIGGCFAYDCLIVVPAYLAWSVVSDRSRASLIKAIFFLIGCAIGFLPHVILRVSMDNAFALEDMPVVGIRGLEGEGLHLGQMLPRLLTTWTSSMPAAFMLSSIELLSSRTLASVVAAFIALGLAGALMGPAIGSRASWLIASVVLMFTFAYAVSPLFFDRVDSKSYLPYRHFAFIVPLTTLLIIQGAGRLHRTASWLRGAWLGISIGASATYMLRSAPCVKGPDEATGWILARKYGHDPERLVGLAQGVPEEYRGRLLAGYGWGMTAALFQHGSGEEGRTMERMATLWSRFPANYRPWMLAGVHTAFLPGVTPVLDARIEPILFVRLTATKKAP